MKRKFLLTALAAVLLSTGSISANATLLPAGTLTASITMASTCTVNAGGMAVFFGIFPVPVTVPDEHTIPASLSVNCPAGTLYMVGITGGSHYGQAVAYGQRHMNDPTLALSTNIPYTIEYGGIDVGDQGIETFSPGYAPSTVNGGQKAIGSPTGIMSTGATDTYNFVMRARPTSTTAGGSPGTFSDLIAVYVSY